MVGSLQAWLLLMWTLLACLLVLQDFSFQDLKVNVGLHCWLYVLAGERTGKVFPKTVGHSFSMQLTPAAA